MLPACWAKSSARACRWGGEWLPLLAVGLGRAAGLPARQIRAVAEFRQRCPAVQDVLVAGTARPTQRPPKAARHRARYAGQQRRHPGKHIIGHDATKRSVLWGETQGGRVHDSPLLQGRGWLPQLPAGLRLWVARGVQGLEPAAPPLAVFQPDKQPRGESLPRWAQGLNRLVATVRVRAAHAIAGIKRLRCLSDVDRNRRPAMEDRVRVVGCGLWNLQLQQA